MSDDSNPGFRLDAAGALRWSAEDTAAYRMRFACFGIDVHASKT